MHVRRIGSSPLKGGRHTSHESAELGLDGVVGDRLFAVVDLTRGTVLKTVENPALLRCDARWADGILTVDIDGERFSGTPAGGVRLDLDYWGRPAPVEVINGPWAGAFTTLLGREVTLVRGRTPGALTYGDSVTIVTTSSLEQLERASAQIVDDARFRSTFVVDTADADAHIEDSWAGRELRLGSAVVRVAEGIPRCAVIDFDATTGAPGTRLLKAIASYRRDAAGVPFGVYASVLEPGWVSRGDRVELLPA